MLSLKLNVEIRWGHAFLLALGPCLGNHSFRFGITLFIHVLHDFHEPSTRIIFAATEIHIIFQLRFFEIGQTFFGRCQVWPLFACRFRNLKKCSSIHKCEEKKNRIAYLRLLSWHKWQRSWFWFFGSWFPHQYHAKDFWPQTCGPYCAHWSLSAGLNLAWMSPRHSLRSNLEHHRVKWKTSQIYHFDPKRSCWFHIHIV